MAKLSDDQIRTSLSDLPGWARSGDSLERHFRFPDFSSAMVFVNRVAEIAEELDHHPDIDIRYDKVRLSLSSHDVGGITSRDIRLAKRIDQLD